jgi:guanylate kinase
MAQASNEMSHWPEYDYIVVNRDLDESVAKVQSVLAAERIKRERQIGLGDFVKRLRDGR